MHFADHRPPHFHAWYGEHETLIAIDKSRVLDGSLPPRALGLVIEWAASRREELMDDWELAAHRQPLRPIEPLR